MSEIQERPTLLTPKSDGFAYTSDSPYNPNYVTWVIDFHLGEAIPVTAYGHLEHFVKSENSPADVRSQLVGNLSGFLGKSSLKSVVARMERRSSLGSEELEDFFHWAPYTSHLRADKAGELLEGLESGSIGYPQVGEKAIQLFSAFYNDGILGKHWQ